MKWLETLAHLGLGEAAARLGANILTLVLVIAVVGLMEHLYHPAGAQATQPPQISEPAKASSGGTAQLPVEAVLPLDGIAREANSHTTIPARPRIDVIQYTVKQGDTLFGIADQFGLKPTTLLFGNYGTLKDRPDYLPIGIQLNILPVDGVYHQWAETDSLNTVAKFYGVTPEDIVNFPGNHLDPDNIGDLDHPNITAGTWLVVPGGTRQFTSWTAPSQLVREDPSVRVWGPGVCSGITTVQVGYGNFVYPTVDHWLSGTPFTPSIRHFGVDFAGAQGNAIYAADAGTVVYSGWNTWGYGNLVIIDHGNGWQTLYAHMSQINVGCGQNVGQGDLIGLVGMTGGTSTGPHLHFEMMNKTLGYVNPLDYLPAK